METGNEKKIKTIKESKRSSIYLVQKNAAEPPLIKKVLEGSHSVYTTLQSCPHPFIPRLYEVTLENNHTTILEEYIEGVVAGSEKLSEKQTLQIIRELCEVLSFLHGKGIIHRDIKPSNILLANDGHIRLIDFDAARIPKEDVEQDTILLGTRGYAPPEQYGFSQTDERSDIYALGITLKQLLGDAAGKPHYQKIIQKCTNLNPDERYQSAHEVKRALSRVWLGIGVAVAAAVIVLLAVASQNTAQISPSSETAQTDSTELVPLAPPANPHWDGETGIAVWDNVHESGIGGEVRYFWRLYCCDTATPPDLEKDTWIKDGDARGNVAEDDDFFPLPLADELEGNGYYYFAVCSAGDQIQYTDSPYALSDAFHFTGEDAPPLPTPTNLAWRIVEGADSREFYATWDLEPYADEDMFYIFVYDSEGNDIMSTYKYKSGLLERKFNGAYIRPEFITADDSFRFAVQALTSRPNEYHSSPAVYPYPSEEYLSPWYSNR